MGITRHLSRDTCGRISRLLAGLYWRLARHRREIVVQNLLPAPWVAIVPQPWKRKVAKALVRQFALKVADLWRYESGLPVDDLFGEWTGWEHFTAAQAQKRGILLITPHLGNWEFGGPLLTKRGVNLQVITLAEPGNGFTELLRASRARWDIETLVIGEDPFGFVENIRRLGEPAAYRGFAHRPSAANKPGAGRAVWTSVCRFSRRSGVGASFGMRAVACLPAID